MHVPQLSIPLANRPDAVCQITDLLAENCINIKALSLTDTTDVGILRLIVNDSEKARQIFTEHGFLVNVNQVLVIEVPDKPGGLASVMQTIRSVDVTMEYMYAFSQKSGKTGLIIFRFNDPDQAYEALDKAGVRILSSVEIDAM